MSDRGIVTSKRRVGTAISVAVVDFDTTGSAPADLKMDPSISRPKPALPKILSNNNHVNATGPPNFAPTTYAAAIFTTFAKAP